MIDTSHHTIGLRFDRSDRDHLDYLAAVKRVEDHGDHEVGLLDKAAAAARHGEPLRVHCTEPEEAQRIADKFVVLGAKRPAVEQLPGG